MPEPQTPAAATKPLPATAVATGQRDVSVASIPQTALAQRGKAPGEVTLQFTRFFNDGQTAYQRLQRAGFPRDVAQRIVARGAAIVIEVAAGDPLFPAGAMVTK